MIVKNPSLKWTKGNHNYVQGIKGKRNYRHSENGNFYNGYGGVRMNADMELNIVGQDENGKTVSLDVRHYLVEAVGRKIMRDDLFEILNQCLPEQIETDDLTGKISESSLAIIRKNYDQLKK